MTAAALSSHSRRGQARAAVDLDHPDALHPLLATQQTRPATVSAGVRRLLWTLLVDAVRCLDGGACVVGAYDGAAKRRYRRRHAVEAAAWFAADDAAWPFSFVRVTEALGLDARALRAALPAAQYWNRRRSRRGRYG